MDRATLNDVLSQVPERLRFPVQIGGVPVGHIDLDRELIRGATHVRAHRQDQGKMMMAAVVSQDAVDSWRQGMQDACDVALLSILQSFANIPTSVDAVVEQLVDDAITPLIKKHRYCAICGKLVRRSQAKTCGDAECKKRLRSGKRRFGV